MEPDYTIYTIPGGAPEYGSYCKEHPELPKVEFIEIDDDGYAHMMCKAGHLIREMT